MNRMGRLRHVFPEIRSRDNDFRINLSLFVLVSLGGWAFYFIFATASYYLTDEASAFPQESGQARDHLRLFRRSWVHNSDCPIFWAEVKGYSRLYDDPREYGFAYLALSTALFLFFTDMGIYFIHRAEYHPSVYKWVHKFPPHSLRTPSIPSTAGCSRSLTTCFPSFSRSTRPYTLSYSALSICGLS
ncbi:hypothetical protein BC938DRAFT_475057 [Jimgerdemannia flammicorona]|uniref:Uncharacterized protein n=1 Tax=Jimgerdemannia flammicorona TaxID=994334 RepID=A0A433QS04_9FUNG|nr:hypothetical protein BC938DRAFT_475057 [Jimgerdemannia flammicorona]